MPLNQIATLLFLYLTLLFAYLTLISGAAVLAIIIFDHLVSTMAAHSSQLQRLNPEEFRTTLFGVWGVTGLALAARAVKRWQNGKFASNASKPDEQEE